MADEDFEIGSHYIAAMKIAGRYSYARRKWVFERVRPIIGSSIGHDAVALKGVDSAKARASLYSTEHGEGRLFGRKQALVAPQAIIASEKPFIAISVCKCLPCAGRSAGHHCDAHPDTWQPGQMPQLPEQVVGRSSLAQLLGGMLRSPPKRLSGSYRALSAARRA